MSTADASARTTAPGDRAAAAALVAGSLAGLVVMAAHPTARDAIRNAEAGAPNTLLVGVHVLGLLVQPLLLAGTLAVTRRLCARPPGAPPAAGSSAGWLAVGANVYFALASVAALAAATASGLVAPGVLRGYAAADAPARAAMLAALDYTGRLNRACARADVLLTGVALLLWSAAMLVDRPGASRPWPRALAGYGVVVGLALVAGAATGRWRLGVHGFGLVVLGQGVWMAGAAAHLWRAPASGGAGRRAPAGPVGGA